MTTVAVQVGHAGDHLEPRLSHRLKVACDWSVSIILSSDWSDMFSLGQPDPVSVTYHKEVQIIFSMKEITKLNTEVED